VLGLASRQFEAALSGAGVTKGGNRRERAAEKEKQKEKEPAKDGPSSPKREGGGRRKDDDDDGNGARLLQLRNLVSYLLLQSSIARPSRPRHARRSELRQWTLCRALWHIPTLTRPFP